jgi:glycosyltransferase involved in cell wall biosynthesis
MREIRVSALILAKDEANNLPGCLESLTWADETIVIVDARSCDATEAIARRFASRTLVRDFDDFASQRNAALALASGDWVFAVDADERVTPELRTELLDAIRNEQNAHAGFRVPIRSEILGRSFSYSGTQNDLPLRLFRRDCGRWTGAVHETVDLEGSFGTFQHALSHRTLANMETFLRKLNAYTSLEARKFQCEGRPTRLTDFTLRPCWTFLKLYVAKQGFRDGIEGFVFCAMSGLSVAIRHWKHREILRAGRAT